MYFFLARNKKILYIGRATSLRNRVRSYFVPNIVEKRSSWIAKMLTEAKGVDFRRTDSVLEAILLEADLIKKFKPPYNTELKDDKSFNCVVITKEDYPQILLIRQKDVRGSTIHDSGLKIQKLYGPFPHGQQLRTALKIIRKIFPFRDFCVPLTTHKRHPHKLENVGVSRGCFNRQIGLCPGVCTGEISREEYAKTIRNIKLFFGGKKTRLVRLLQREMMDAAQRQEFERAGELKRRIFSLRHIQDVALLKRNSVSASVPRSCLPRESEAILRGSASVQCTLRIEAYDLSHFGGKEIVGAMSVVENGEAKQSEYRLFKLRGIQTQDEVAGLQEIIRRRLNHPEWRLPSLIVVDGNEVQKKAAEKVIASAGKSIPVVAVVKDERHRPRQIIGEIDSLYYLRPSASSHPRESAVLLANGEAHRFVLKFQRTRRLFSRIHALDRKKPFGYTTPNAEKSELRLLQTRLPGV